MCIRDRVWSGLVWSGVVWSGLVSGLVWSGLVWSGVVWCVVWWGVVVGRLLGDAVVRWGTSWWWCRVRRYRRGGANVVCRVRMVMSHGGVECGAFGWRVR